MWTGCLSAFSVEVVGYSCQIVIESCLVKVVVVEVALLLAEAVNVDVALLFVEVVNVDVALLFVEDVNVDIECFNANEVFVDIFVQLLTDYSLSICCNFPVVIDLSFELIMVPSCQCCR